MGISVSWTHTHTLQLTSMADWSYITTRNGRVLGLSSNCRGSRIECQQRKQTRCGRAVDEQLWRFECDGHLVNKCGLVADVERSNRGCGARLIGWPKHCGANQKFEQRGCSSSTKIVSKLNNYVWEVSHCGTTVSNRPEGNGDDTFVIAA